MGYVPNKIVVALQFWEGDKDKAMSLARLIADIEPAKNEKVEFAFFARFDATHDEETVAYVSRKFNVWKMTCRIPGTGWPDGCNAMAIDLMHQANEWSHDRWKQIKAVYLIESDILPMRRDWLARLTAEWDVTSAQGKLLMGSFYPFHSPVGHINGNMFIDPQIVSRIKGLQACPPGRAWDTEFAVKFSPHWYKSVQMTNHYDFKRNIPGDVLFSTVDGKTPVCVVHGVKDGSGLRQVRHILFP